MCIQQKTGKSKSSHCLTMTPCTEEKEEDEQSLAPPSSSTNGTNPSKMSLNEHPTGGLTSRSGVKEGNRSQKSCHRRHDPRFVSFGLVEVIELDQILGDNPSAFGAPISVGWEIQSRTRYSSIQQYEEREELVPSSLCTTGRTRRRRRRCQLYLSQSEREQRYVE